MVELREGDLLFFVFVAGHESINQLSMSLVKAGEPDTIPLAFDAHPFPDNFSFRIDDLGRSGQLKLQPHLFPVVLRLDQVGDPDTLGTDVRGPGHVRNASHVLVEVDVQVGSRRPSLLAHLYFSDQWVGAQG